MITTENKFVLLSVSCINVITFEMKDPWTSYQMIS